MSPDQRRNTLAKIHIARKDLALDEDTYRAMLAELTGKTSSKDMSDNQLGKVLNHLRNKGWKPRAPSATGSQRRQDTSDQASKVRALWLFLYELGQVGNPSEAALATYVKRIAKVDDMHWANAHAMERIIETLKKWAMRTLPQRVDTLWKILDSTGLRSILTARLAWKKTLGPKGTRAGFDKFHAAYDEIMRHITKEGIRLDPSIAPRVQPATRAGTDEKEAIQSAR